jgi:predicted nucleotide-binding protein
MAKPESPEPVQPLPMRTTFEDIKAVCGYLARKPTGATYKEMGAVIDPKHLDGRKMIALRRWGFLEEIGDKVRLLDRGRRVAKDNASRAAALQEAVRAIEPYRATVERAMHKSEMTILAVDIAAHWHGNFTEQVSSNDDNLNDQVMAFLQLAEGAELGRLVLGRRGQPTRFEFNESNVARFVEDLGAPAEPLPAREDQDSDATEADTSADALARVVSFRPGAPAPADAVARVFITHGKNMKVLEQVKRLLTKVARFEAVVAQERETPAKPVSDKVMDDMRTCQAAVIHVGAEGVWTDGEGQEHPHINPNVLIEIGAAMALYNRRFILLVEEGVRLPSNLQGLYECRYKGDDLSLDGAMKLVEALNTLR